MKPTILDIHMSYSMIWERIGLFIWQNNIDFKPVITKTSEIVPLSIVVVLDERGYDSEENHIMVREKLGAFSVIIPARNEGIPICKTHGRRYRKNR